MGKKGGPFYFGRAGASTGADALAGKEAISGAKELAGRECRAVAIRKASTVGVALEIELAVVAVSN